MKVSFISFCLSSILLLSCNQTSPPSSSNSQDRQIPAAKVQIKNDSLQTVFANYIEVKDALVASDVSKAKVAGSELNNSLNKVKGCENTAKIAQKLLASDSIDEQRKLFTLLTSDIIPVFKQTEIRAGSIFIQFCPMANDGDGGYWLAKEDQIRNPYYGDKMLKCGKVVEEFKQSFN